MTISRPVLGPKTGSTKRIMLLLVRRLHLQFVARQIHPEFLRVLWVLADKQTHNYYVLISAEEEIGSEALT